MEADDFDVLLVGGGLQNGLVALAVAARHPGARIALVEAGAMLGGNHTWSFHTGDVPLAMRAVVEPLVQHRVSAYDVRFPEFQRVVPHPYATFTGTHLHAVVTAALDRPGSSVLLGSRAEVVSSRAIRLDSGRVLTGDIVVDARGPDAAGPASNCGYQKFVGLELALEPGSQPPPATLMDATVAQTDGYRFMYTLPLGRDRCLVEDTYYSDSPHLERARLWDSVLKYASARGIRVRGVVREESGVLPLPWAGEGPRAQARGPLLAGFGGKWFHPATGYSFPVALRLAQHIATSDRASLFGSSFLALVNEHTRQARFCHVLNRLMFLAMDPRERWQALARFYRLPDETIARFYALELTLVDRRRILLGRPPKGISLRGVLAAMEA